MKILHSIGKGVFLFYFLFAVFGIAMSFFLMLLGALVGFSHGSSGANCLSLLACIIAPGLAFGLTLETTMPKLIQSRKGRGLYAFGLLLGIVVAGVAGVVAATLLFPDIGHESFSVIADASARRKPERYAPAHREAWRERPPG